MLKAIKPEIVKPAKPKIMVTGRSGVGKTMFALEFPSVYYIDTEGGAIRKQYREKLIAAGGMYMGKDQGSQDFPTVIEEIKSLATTKHPYKTVVLDSYSQIYNIAAAMAEERVGNEYGRDKKEANRPTRQLLRWIDILDMNVILVCHSKALWEQKGNTKERAYSGTTFDGYEKLEYLLDLWIEIKKDGNQRSYVVRKTRIESFLDGREFPLNYKQFAELYGKEVIEQETKPIVLCTPDQIKQILHLVSVVKLEDGKLNAFMEKNNANSYEELPSEKAQYLINELTKKLQGAA